MKKRTLTLQQIYREGTSKLKEAGIREAALDAWYLLEFATGITKASYYGNPDKEIKEEEAARYLAYIPRYASAPEENSGFRCSI